MNIMRTFSPLILCAVLAACGGGGSTATTSPTAPTPPASTTPPPPAPAPTLTLSSTAMRTIAGGSAIPLTAKLSSGGAVHWQLAAGSPGSLSADTGGAVRYLPPAGALTAPATVTVTASGDGASAAMNLAVTQDPGAPGLYQMDWRTSTEPTMFAPVDVAADLAGNVYALLIITNVPGPKRGNPQLVKIAPDGTITTLFGRVNDVAIWFGQPDSSNNALRLFYTSGFVLDRAGNLYFAAPGGGGFGVGAGQQVSAGPAILKITPNGSLSELAGTQAAQVGAMLDGTGSAARFLTPSIVGIDLDDNVYVLDKDNTPRKVTPAGVVTTLSALPAGLNADMNGNTYSYDAAAQKLMRTGPDGARTVETSVPYCSNFTPAPPLTCLSGPVTRIAPIGGASYVVLTDTGVRRLVLPH